MKKFDIEKAREELGEVGGEGFCDCETRNLLGAAIERIEELEQKVFNLRAELTGMSPVMAGFIATPLENKVAWHDTDLERVRTALIEKQSIILNMEFLLWNASTGYSGKNAFAKVIPGVQKEYADIAREQLQAEGLL
jgi:hypothetical protein